MEKVVTVNEMAAIVSAYSEPIDEQAVTEEMGKLQEDEIDA